MTLDAVTNISQGRFSESGHCVQESTGRIGLSATMGQSAIQYMDFPMIGLSMYCVGYG